MRGPWIDCGFGLTSTALVCRRCQFYQLPFDWAINIACTTEHVPQILKLLIWKLPTLYPPSYPQKLGPLGIPVFGVCMGHQCIGQVFGGKVVRAPNGVMHGKISLVYHNNLGLMKDMENPFEACRYHSLVISQDGFPADELEVRSFPRPPLGRVATFSFEISNVPSGTCVILLLRRSSLCFYRLTDAIHQSTQMDALYHRSLPGRRITWSWPCGIKSTR